MLNVAGALHFAFILTAYASAKALTAARYSEPPAVHIASSTTALGAADLATLGAAPADNENAASATANMAAILVDFMVVLLISSSMEDRRPSALSHLETSYTID